jgi:hypothetical protein
MRNGNVSSDSSSSGSDSASENMGEGTSDGYSFHDGPLSDGGYMQDMGPDLVDDGPSTAPAAPATEKRKSVWIEEEVDEDEVEGDEVYVESFAEEMRAGEPLQGAEGKGKGEAKTVFEELREDQKKYGLPPYYPFSDEDEWEVARWLMESGASQRKKDEFLRLKKVSISNS